MRNIELKARLADRDRAEACCEDLGAAFQGDIHQVDTYFRVHEGRLKLREKDPGGGELIFYRREDIAEARASAYYLAPAAPELKALLAEAFDVIAVVDKVRSLWLWENVRIHLDRVQGLGDFIEFEAVLSDDHDEADGHEKVAHLQKAFALTEPIQGSYLDLILAIKDRERNCRHAAASLRTWRGRERLMGATAKHSLGVPLLYLSYYHTPKRVWRWHPMTTDGIEVPNKPIEI